MGRKRIFQMLSLHGAMIPALGDNRLPVLQKSVRKGPSPHLFRPMYAGANMGHPSREQGFVLRSNYRARSGAAG
jgi:hypothetical protein